MKTAKIDENIGLIFICLLLINIVNINNVSSKEINSVNQKMPIVGAPRLGEIDSMTYSGYLEEQKRFQNLLTLLKNELSALDLMAIFNEIGIELTEHEKKTVKEIFKNPKSADPIVDFLVNNRLTNEIKDYDPEGRLFLYDSIAEIYTYKLVDFKKAEDFNQKCLDQYNKILKIGIQNLPISIFFNSKRHLYYFKKFNKQNFSYEINQKIPKTVRTFDFEEVYKRINERKKFLTLKLSGRDNFHRKNRPNNERCLKLLKQIESFLEDTDHYSDFQKNFLLSSQVYKFFNSTGSESVLDKLAGYAQKALNARQAKATETQNQVCFLHYWIGLSHLKLGELNKGIHHMEIFLKCIDEFESLKINEFSRRKELVNKINEEQMETIKKIAKDRKEKAVIIFIIGMASIAASAAAAASSPSLILDYSGVSQTLIQSGVSSVTTVYEANQIIDREKQTEQMRKIIAKYMTPRSLKLNRFLDKFEMIDYFLELGKAYGKTGQPEKALNNFQEGINIVERQRSTILTENQRISYFSAKQKLYKNIIITLIKLNRNEEALEYVERAKSRAFIDILGSEKVELKTRSQTQIYSDKVLRDVEIDTIVTNKNIGMDQVNKVISKVQRGVFVSLQDQSSQNTEFELSSLSSVQTLNAHEIKKLFTPETAIVEYFLTNERLFIFIIHNNKVFVNHQAIDFDDLALKTAKWRNGIKNRVDNKELAKEFYQLLIAPVEIKLSANQLIIVPHGVLHYLPFQALYDGNQFLIERFAISYSPSATVLKMVRDKTSSGTKKALIIGNPTMDLNFAEEEAKTISKNLEGSDLLINEKATETFVKNEAENYDIIHMATHGLYSPEKPFQSKILLSSDSTNDGVLSVAEIFSTKWNASLVTLSACETGLSDYTSGDELIGFQRAIMFAGTRSIIASLWKVDDEATSYLMDNFYKYLLTMPKNIAIQRAQLDAMKRFPNPFYWGSFNLTGSVN